ncbi:hypothetical protein DOTSEDRAFT_74251 [Dothistroma septosporum NZE10]|uniref:Uncharacterized protein n=1 Tax=Dothistroma septosporum (strain NZE10 / CBS 128990) TaxID=675120 RepID=N1PGG5_DOTSN|nr:hypothetical protein DOTSEDRAFT_74251 [Dothistroma septosporum NZE10]
MGEEIVIMQDEVRCGLHLLLDDKAVVCRCRDNGSWRQLLLIGAHAVFSRCRVVWKIPKRRRQSLRAVMAFKVESIETAGKLVDAVVKGFKANCPECFRDT